MDNIPVKVFKKYMPKIDRIEKLREDILEQAEIFKEEMKSNKSYHSNKKVENRSCSNSTFFSGCNTKEKLDKRYKALCKTYHPDGVIGDEETFKMIQNEYEQLKDCLS